MRFYEQKKLNEVDKCSIRAGPKIILDLNITYIPIFDYFLTNTQISKRANAWTKKIIHIDCKGKIVSEL